MKLFVFLIALLAAVNVAVCQTANSAGIQKEIDENYAVFRVQVQKGAEQLKAYAQNRVDKILEQFSDWTDRITNELKTHGSNVIANSFEKATDNLLATLKKQLDLSDFNVDVNQALRAWEQNQVQPVQDDIDDLKAAVDRNPKTYKCWTDNKGELRRIFETFVKNVGVAVSEEEKSLDAKLTALAETVKNEVRAIENFLQNKTNAEIVKYFVANAASWRTEFQKYRQEAVNDFKTAFANIRTKVSANMQSARTDFRTLKTRVTACIRATKP